MKTRRILAMIVAAVLLIATVSVIGILSVSAEVTTITTAEQFAELDGKSGEYKLGGNITLTGTVPSFSGTLDGNGCTVTVSAPVFGTLSGEVKNLTIAGTITSDETTPVGALANTVSGTTTVTNVTNEASITASAATGVGTIGAVDGAYTVSISGSSNSGTMAGLADVGGFIGYVKGASRSSFANVTIEDSVNSGAASMTTTVKNHGVAGFIGGVTNHVITITRSINKGNISYVGGDNGVAGFIGGSLGWTNGSGDYGTLTVSYCANVGAITCSGTNGRLGGIAGRMDRSTNYVSTYEYCYNTATVSGGVSASGITGYTNKKSMTHVSNCYNAGTLDSAGTYGIGCVGDNSTSYFTSNQNYHIGSQNAVNKPIDFNSVADMAALNTALLALDDSPYCVDGTKNGGYAVLKWQCTHSEEDYTLTCAGNVCNDCGVLVDNNGSGEHEWGDWTETVSPTATTEGEAERECGKCHVKEDKVLDATGKITPVDDVYNVYNQDQMVWLAYFMNAGEIPTNASIALKDDITLTNGMTYINKTFTGVFDGEGHTLSGLTDIIFYELGGTFINVTLDGSYTTTEKRNGAVSLRTPNGGGAHVENVISQVDTNTTCTGGNIGGIIGYILGNNTIVNCKYSGTLTATGTANAVGGIVGYLNANSGTTTITGCVFDGEIVIKGDCTDVFAGGILGGSGKNGNEHVVNSTVTGTITVEEDGTAVVGGIVGRFQTPNDKPASTVKNSIFNGTVNAEASVTVEGIVGEIVANTTVTDSFDLTAEEKVGDPFTMGGVTYQKYAFGYVNATTSALVSTGMVASNAIDAYISLRQNADDHDVRFVLLADMEALADVAVADVTITFKLGDETVKTVTKKFGGDANDFTAYEAVLAAGEPYFAQEGYAFFGLVVIDIPNGAWDSVTLTVTNASDSSTILAPVAAEYEANNG